jgi:hypothetical protein
MEESRCSGHERQRLFATDTGVLESPHLCQAKRQLHLPRWHNTWRARCGESRTSGSEGGPVRLTSREDGRAPRTDPTQNSTGPKSGPTSTSP